MENKKKEGSPCRDFRMLPVLERDTCVFGYGGEDFSYDLEKLNSEIFEIDESSFYGSANVGTDHIEIYHETVSVEEYTEPYTDEIKKIPHLNIVMRYIPGGCGKYKYSMKSGRGPDPDGKFCIDAYGFQMSTDIVKYCAPLLYPYLYWVLNVEPLDEKRKQWLDRAMRENGFVIDSIDATDEGMISGFFMDWIRSVGGSIASAYESPTSALEAILRNKSVYVVYGLFDPATRENLVEKNLVDMSPSYGEDMEEEECDE